MDQPDLGLKVAEMRQQKGLTQEQLAEYCEVSTRTIQRIESGEVEPRPFTRNSLSNILDFNFSESSLSNENFWLAALHLSSVFCIVLIPLLIWSAKKKQSYKLMLRSLEGLKFIKSDAGSLEVQTSTQGKMIEMAFNLQAFQLKEGI